MTHLVSWHCDIQRQWHPVYAFGGGRYDTEPIPPHYVNISAEFDDNEAALDFERNVRALLEEASK